MNEVGLFVAGWSFLAFGAGLPRRQYRNVKCVLLLAADACFLLFLGKVFLGWH